jgi:4-carboxymuconolactone decarboxylase
MVRVPEPEFESLTDRQKALATSIGAIRGGTPATGGPWGLLLRNPELCERAQRFGTMLRDNTSVPKRLSELTIAITARHWTAQFEWNAHAHQAVTAGVDAEVIESIRHRKRPAKMKKDEEAVYNFVTELYANKKVSDATYKAMTDAIGTDAAIELTAIAGFYSTVAMLIVAHEVALPPGVAKPLAD